MNVSTLCLIIYLSEVFSIQYLSVCSTSDPASSFVIEVLIYSVALRAFWNVEPRFTVAYLLAECAL